MHPHMSSFYPDPYETALEQALHLRGLERASYVANIEHENTELRRLLIKAKPFLPPAVQNELKMFIESHDIPS